MRVREAVVWFCIISDAQRDLKKKKKKKALLRPVTSAARISLTSPYFPQHGDPRSDSAAPH